MRVVSCVGLLLGSFLGAGFVSGREVASYFSRFGNHSYIAIIVSILLLFLLIIFFLMISQRVRSFSHFTKLYFGKISVIINVLMTICVLIINSSMLAGTMSLAESFSVNKYLFVVITIILAYFIVMGNTQSLSKVNLILIPFVLIILFITSSKCNLQNSLNGSVLLSVVSGCSYVFINIVSVGLLLIEIGHKYNKKEKLLVAIFSSLIIGCVLFVVNKAILANDLVLEMFPSLALARGSHFLYPSMQLSIFFGLFTTLISNTYLLSSYINNFIKSKHMSILFSLLLSWFISTMGFGIIVGYIYWFIGGVGLLIVMGVICREKKNRVKPYS